MPQRATHTARTLQAGCFVCDDGLARWTGPNAQAVAARHHDSTGHRTWCDVTLSVWYGDDAVDPRQADIEDSIAAAKSGDRPSSAPLPVPDAPAARTAGVAEAFPDERLEQAGRILDGLFLIHASPPDEFDADRLFQALLLREQRTWAATAMARMAITGETWAVAMRAALLELYETIPPSARSEAA